LVICCARYPLVVVVGDEHQEMRYLRKAHIDLGRGSFKK